MPPLDLLSFRSTHGPLLERLYEQSGATRWSLHDETFAEALYRSALHRFPDGARPADVASYLQALHVADLALACACRAGDGAAWDHVVLECRPALYAAARSVAGDSYRELADSIYAELYGVSNAGSERTSLFAWYHGRSRLVTWLRAVLVQRHVDARRAAARLDQWDPADDAEALTRVAPAPPDPGRAHAVAIAQDALDRAVAILDARDRLRLRLYYGEDLTLVQIGRITGEHEATVSRKLGRARTQLRRHVEQHLRAEHGLGDAAIAECVAYAAEAPELHLTRLLSRAEDG